MKNIFSALCLLTVSSVGFSQIVLSPGSSANVSGQEVRCESSSIVKPKVCEIEAEDSFRDSSSGAIYSRSFNVKIDGKNVSFSESFENSLVILHNLISSKQCDVIAAQNCSLNLTAQLPEPKYSTQSSNIKIGKHTLAEDASNQTGGMKKGSALVLYDRAVKLGLCLK